MTSALLIVDVQNDFTEGGALAVSGGDAVAERISAFLRSHSYPLVVASQDWHDADSDNGGHFSSHPDFRESWPEHCVAGTPGAAFDPLLDTSAVTDIVRKGQGAPAYSMFEGTDEQGRTTSEILRDAQVDRVDVVGLATDHCVRATVLDALGAGLSVRVFDDLVAGVAPETSAAALAEMRDAGATVVDSVEAN